MIEPCGAAQPTSEARAMHPDVLRRLLRAKDRMDAESHKDWSVESLATISCVSTAHFARSFRKAFGIPPHRYLLSRRIERAQAMLRETDLSVTEIALRTGWESIGTFGRTFRQITGTNPVQRRSDSCAAKDRVQRIPACVLRASERPPLERAVSEKRASRSETTIAPSSTENHDD